MSQSRLKKLITLLPEKEKIYRKLQYEYDKRYTEIYLKDFENLRNEELRKHSARQILENEGLVRPLMEASLKYRTLLNEKDILMKIYE
jgi:hypothetical protein